MGRSIFVHIAIIRLRSARVQRVAGIVIFVALLNLLSFDLQHLGRGLILRAVVCRVVIPARIRARLGSNLASAVGGWLHVVMLGELWQLLLLLFIFKHVLLIVVIRIFLSVMMDHTYLVR